MTTNPNLLEPLGRFRSDLVVEPQKKDGATGAYRIFDPTSNVSHVLTELEYAVATCMNGERNAMEVSRHAARLGHPVQADHVESFHRELEALSFVYRDQPPTLTRAPDTSHRDDAKRFVEEAKRELALGRIEVARDLLDAALAIDRVAATDAASGSSSTPSTPTPTVKPPAPALTGAALGPVLDYLKDWNVPAAPSASASPPVAGEAIPLPGGKRAEMPVEMPALQTGATARWSPPSFEALAPIDINLDDAGPPVPPIVANDVAPPRKSRRATRWLAAAAAIVVVGVGVGATVDFTMPTGVLAFPEAIAATPPPPAAAVVVEDGPVAPVAPPALPEAVVVNTNAAPEDEAVAPVAPVEAVEAVENAAKKGDTDVVAPAKGKFMRALVMSGLKVKEGQRIAILAAPNGKQMVLTAPAAGIFEATAPLGKTVGKGDVVGVVHVW